MDILTVYSNFFKSLCKFSTQNFSIMNSFNINCDSFNIIKTSLPKMVNIKGFFLLIQVMTV